MGKGKNGGHRDQDEMRSKRGGIMNKLRNFTYKSPPPTAHKPTYYTPRVFPSLESLVASRQRDDSQEHQRGGLQDYSTLTIVQPIRVKDGAVLRRGSEDEDEEIEVDLTVRGVNSKAARAHKLRVLKVLEKRLLVEMKKEEAGEDDDNTIKAKEEPGITPLPLSVLCIRELAKILKEFTEPEDAAKLGALFRRNLTPAATSLLSLYASPFGYDTMSCTCTSALANPEAKVLCLGRMTVRDACSLILHLRQAPKSSLADSWEVLSLPSSQTGLEVESIFKQLKGPHTLYLYNCLFAAESDVGDFDLLGPNLRHLALMHFTTSPVSIPAGAGASTRVQSVRKGAYFAEHEKIVRIFGTLFMSSPAFANLESLRLEYCTFGFTLSGLLVLGTILLENRNMAGTLAGNVTGGGQVEAAQPTLPSLRSLHIATSRPLGDDCAIVEVVSFFDAKLDIALTFE